MQVWEYFDKSFYCLIKGYSFSYCLLPRKFQILCRGNYFIWIVLSVFNFYKARVQRLGLSNEKKVFSLIDNTKSVTDICFFFAKFWLLTWKLEYCWQKQKFELLGKLSVATTFYWILKPDARNDKISFLTSCTNNKLGPDYPNYQQLFVNGSLKDFSDFLIIYIKIFV